jgi:hypothetical protein
MLGTSTERRQIFQDYAAELRQSTSDKPQLSEQLGSSRSACELEILEHLKMRATEMMSKPS